MPFKEIRAAISGPLFFLLSLSALATSLVEFSPLETLACFLLGAYIFIEADKLTRAAALVSGLLLAASLYLSDSPANMLKDGMISTMPFVLIFASVGWLQSTAVQSPTLNALRRSVAAQRPGKRSACLLISSHVLGSNFNLAGLGMLTSVLDKMTGEKLSQRAVSAAMWGFCATTCWSPFFAGTTVVLTALPAVNWSDVAPLGLCVAVAQLLYGWIYDRLINQPDPITEIGETEYPSLDSPAIFRTIGILVPLFASTLFLVETFNLSLAASIALCVPLYCTIWLILIHSGSLASTANSVWMVIKSYRNQRNETALFSSANVFGVSISAFMSSHPTDPIVAVVGSLAAPLLASLLISVFLLVSALGVHPVISIVIFTSTFSAESFGISETVLAVILMSLWGMGSSISPLSGITLLTGRIIGQPSFVLAWRWNLPFISTLIIFLGFIASLISVAS